MKINLVKITFRKNKYPYGVKANKNFSLQKCKEIHLTGSNLTRFLPKDVGIDLNV